MAVYKEGNDEQDCVDPTGIESTRGLVDGMRRVSIRCSALQHVGDSPADYEDRLLKTRPKRRSRP